MGDSKNKQNSMRRECKREIPDSEIGELSQAMNVGTNGTVDCITDKTNSGSITVLLILSPVEIRFRCC